MANFVGKKINSLRINSGGKECSNLGVVRTNTMKTLHNYFEKESVEKIFICFADPHFKKVNHRRRIISHQLLTDYAYVLKNGGRLYQVTDVKDLYDWNNSHLEKHPMFERIPEEELAKEGKDGQGDPCIKAMREGTDEAQKVIRNQGNIWHAVWRKLDLNDPAEKQKVEHQALQLFL